MNIPKDTVVCYDNLTTTDLTVKGHLKVTGILTARHIQGGTGFANLGDSVFVFYPQGPPNHRASVFHAASLSAWRDEK